MRGDVNSIRLGNKVNIQDGAVIHCTYKKTKTVLLRQEEKTHPKKPSYRGQEDQKDYLHSLWQRTAP